MNYLVLVSHGNFANGLLDTLGMFTNGERTDLLAITMQKNEDTSSIKNQFTKFLSSATNEDHFIVCADIVGGSPLTAVLEVASSQGILDKCLFLGGMNLAMVLTAALLKDTLPFEVLKNELINESTQSISSVDLQVKENEEEI